MVYTFSAEPKPSPDLFAALEVHSPHNPVYTPAYVEAKRILGFQPWIFALSDGSRVVTACTAFMKANFLVRSLEIVSLPALPSGDDFWRGLLRFCRTKRVSRLTVNSFLSPSTAIPALPDETSRKTRFEFVLDLQDPTLWKGLGSNHRRNIKQAIKTGVQIRRRADTGSCEQHAHLIEKSMSRRQRRGEQVSDKTNRSGFIAMTQSGAGEIFQAVLGDEVLSSILVLMAPQGGYYQSAGTSPEGMACGASHLLVHEIAGALRECSMKLFNLGGADPASTGLYRFKSGFGARIVELEAAECFLGTKLQKRAIAVAQFVRDKGFNPVARLVGGLKYQTGPAA